MKWVGGLLSFFHFQPADKSVDIADKEHNKADENGYVGAVGQRSKSPEDYEHDIVCSVKQRKISTSSECKVDRGEAGGNGNGAGNKICSIEIAENKVKEKRNQNGKQRHKSDFKLAEMIDTDLGVTILKWISEPCNKREESHGSSHTEVSDHFTVIVE